LNGLHGTSGQILTSQGAESSPVWGTPAAGVTQLVNLSDVASASNTNGFALIADGSTGYVGRALVEADISDFGSYLTSYTETDPAYAASQAFNIGAGDITNLSNLSGTNTGDQDLSGLLVKANNLSDLTNTTTAKTNLGLGSLATLSDLSAFSTDNLSQGSTNLYSQWDTATGGINYAGGNVGVGTNAPSSRLGIQGSASGNIFQAQTSTGASGLLIGNDGKVTIGNHDPASSTFGGALEVFANVDTSNQYVSTMKLGRVTSDGNGLVRLGFYEHFDLKASIQAGRETNANDGFISFTTRNSVGQVFEGMRITGASTVGIGTATPSARFEVRGSGTGTGLLAQFTDSANTARLTVLDNGNIGIGTTTPSQKLSVVGNAQFTGVGSGAYATDLNLTSEGILTTSASDERLKKNIQSLDASSTLDKLLQLNPTSFDWKSNGAHDIGLIAQEVELVFPELVFTNKTDGFKGVNYSRLPALLISAVQELAGRVAEFANYIETKILRADRVNTKELCIDDICITKNQLQQLLDGESVSPSSNSDDEDTTPIEDTSDDTGTSIQDTSTSTDSTVTPEESSTPTEAPVVEAEPESSTTPEQNITDSTDTSDDSKDTSDPPSTATEDPTPEPEPSPSEPETTE